MLAYEPISEEFASAGHGVRILGIAVVRAVGKWPTMRHVFELDDEAALHVEVDSLGLPLVFAVGYAESGDEILQAL